MRLIKMFGLAMLAALASMAFIGASSASADKVCNADPGHGNECAGANQVSAITASTLAGAKALLLSSSGNIEMECDSTVEGEATTSEGAHTGINGLIKNLTFTNCAGICLSAEGHSEPWRVLGNGLALTLTVFRESHSTGLNPGALLKGCTFFKVNCLYELSANTTLDLELKTGGTKVIANREALTRSSGPCPETTTWDATYFASNRWVTALP